MKAADPLPKSVGAYVLVLFLPRARRLQVGRLGVATFPAGLYVYLGQAGGPGGLRGRLRRHLRGPRRLRWHIDYLRTHAEPVAWGWRMGTHGPHGPWECLWTQQLARHPWTFVPLPGFGASDCRLGCPAHLLGLRVSLEKASLPARLGLQGWETRKK